MGQSVRFYGVVSLMPLYWLCYRYNNQIANLVNGSDLLRAKQETITSNLNSTAMGLAAMMLLGAVVIGGGAAQQHPGGECNRAECRKNRSPCASCHVNPSGGGKLTARGQRFQKTRN